jgi:hypothetical protein
MKMSEAEMYARMSSAYYFLLNMSDMSRTGYLAKRLGEAMSALAEDYKDRTDGNLAKEAENL